MKFSYLGVAALLAVPITAPAASREIQELQRDVGLLQEQIKALQTSENEKLTELKTLVQQAINTADKASTGVAVIQGTVQQNLRDQESKVVTPVVGLGTRIDSMANDFRMLQQSVSDLTGMIGKLQNQLTDLNNAVKVLQAPPAPPPSSSAPGGDVSNPGAGLGPPPSALPSATELYNNATRDRSTGKLDLALSEFSDYLKYYGNTSLAPNAQYYIAFIHYSQKDYEKALKEFDLVLEKYPDEDSKKAESMYYKGMTLVQLGHRTQGAEEFKEFLKRFPNHDLARQACSQLTTMGLKCGSPRAAAPAKRKRA
ncbi:MAG TPA: tetratricopeptide repeat protein [Bryobacteraceae bacterium]|nr:tetratricopeptide repeat protein [Bryobacteraceae bacterium]